MSKRAAVLAIALGIGGGCTGARPSGEESVRHPQGTAHVGGDVVSTVDGRPIHLADVTRVARKTGESPEDSLRHLQAQELLAAEARGRGYRSRPEVARAFRKALVQALLSRAVEGKVTEADLTEAQLREMWRLRHGARPRAEGGVPDASPGDFSDAGEALRRQARMRERNQRLHSSVEQLRRRYPIRRHPDSAEFVSRAELGGLTRLP